MQRERSCHRGLFCYRKILELCGSTSGGGFLPGGNLGRLPGGAGIRIREEDKRGPVNRYKGFLNPVQGSVF